jgi:hypothetical protein
LRCCLRHLFLPPSLTFTMTRCRGGWPCNWPQESYCCISRAVRAISRQSRNEIARFETAP